MSLPAELLAAVGRALGDPVARASGAAGGSINLAARLELESGRAIFLKHRPDAGSAEYAAEAAGLAWLAEAGALPTPTALAQGAEPHPWLALEWVEPGALSEQGAERLGRGLARLHRAGASAHGALPTGHPDRKLRIGPVEFPLTESDSWPRLYAEQLIGPLVGMARDKGALTANGAARIVRLCDRIDEVAGPTEAPARLHGDLWAGNVHADAAGRPWLIDPAAYGGHREIDLAMLRLFGTPGGDRVFAAYGEEWPLADGHAERVGLWQLLPLLVHAVLFGGGYGDQAVAAARPYG